MPLTISVVVCAYNEERLLPACLATLSRQSRPPDEIVVVNNASTDGTRAIAASTPGVKVVDEPRKGLVIARETGRRHARGELLAFLDADCQAPDTWLERVEAEFGRRSRPAAVTGCYRFHDWDFTGRLLIRLYDYTLAPATHFLAQRVLRMGAVLYGGNFTVHRDALEAIGGFDTTIEFHGEDSNVGRRLAKVGTVVLSPRCFIYTSARRYKAMGQDPRAVAVHKQLRGRDFPAPSAGHHPRRHQELRCQARTRICSATSTCTRPGATGRCPCANWSTSTDGPATST